MIPGFVLKAKGTKARHQEGLTSGQSASVKGFVPLSSGEPGPLAPAWGLSLRLDCPLVGGGSSAGTPQPHSWLPSFTWHQEGASAHLLLPTWSRLPLRPTTPPGMGTK